MDVPENNTYIYSATTGGWSILANAINSSSHLKNAMLMGKAVYLIRVSNTDNHMLTKEYVILKNIDAIKEKLFASENIDHWNTRYMLSPSGWCEANKLDDPEIKKIRETMIEVDPDTIGRHYVEQLERLICSDPTFETQHRVNPPKNQQTRCEIYSSYSASRTKKEEVRILPELRQSITCEITGKPFKDPVIVTKNHTTARGWMLYSGRSYERSKLQELNVPSGLYRDNYPLKKAIMRLGSGQTERIETLGDKLEIDNLDDHLNQLAISARSFSKMNTDSEVVDLENRIANLTISVRKTTNNTSMEVDQDPFEEQEENIEVIPNLNLQQFVRGWPLNKDSLFADLESKKRQKVDRDDDLPKAKKQRLETTEDTVIDEQ